MTVISASKNNSKDNVIVVDVHSCGLFVWHKYVCTINKLLKHQVDSCRRTPSTEYFILDNICMLICYVQRMTILLVSAYNTTTNIGAEKRQRGPAAA